jgi:hypothetical protein
MFAKLYGSDDDQILVKLDSGDSGPEVRFYFKPGDCFGVCSVAMIFEDSDAGWDQAEVAFGYVDESLAIDVVAKQKEEIQSWLLNSHADI